MQGAMAAQEDKIASYGHNCDQLKPITKIRVGKIIWTKTIWFSGGKQCIVSKQNEGSLKSLR